MCTFNIALDDQLVKTARSSFLNVEEMTAWMENQITVLLRNHVMSSERESSRKPHKHDALMGVISLDAEKDNKHIHIERKENANSIRQVQDMSVFSCFSGEFGGNRDAHDIADELHNSRMFTHNTIALP